MKAEQILLISGIFGCTLDGCPASLDVNRGTTNLLFVVKTDKSRAVFTLPVVSHVLTHGGHFRSRELARRASV